MSTDATPSNTEPHQHNTLPWWTVTLGLAALSAVVIAVADAVNLAIAAPAIALALLTRAQSRRWSIGVRLLFAGVWMFVTVPLLMGVLQVIGVEFGVANIYAPLAVVATVLHRLRFRTDASKRLDHGHKATLVALVPWGIAVVVTAMLTIPGFTPRGGMDPGAHRFSLVAGSEDGASHYSIYQEMLDHRGLLFDQEGRKASAHWPYPPASHANATMVGVVAEHTVGLRSRMQPFTSDGFWLANILMFTALVGALAVAALEWARALGASVPARILASAGAGLLTVFWYPFTLYQHGFMPQVGALMLLTATLLLFGPARRAIGFNEQLMLWTLLLVGAGWTWSLTVPAVALLGVAWLIQERKRIRRTRIPAVVGAFVLGTALVLFATYMLSYAASVDNINAAGGVTSVSDATLLALSAVGVIGLLSLRVSSVEMRRNYGAIAIALSGMLVLSLALRAYQEITAGEASYFYFKSLYSVLLVVIIMLPAVLAAAIASDRWSKRRQVASGALGLFIAAALIGALDATSDAPNPTWQYLHGNLVSTHQRTYAYFNYRVGQEQALRDKYVFVWGTGEGSLQDYVATRWLSAANGRSDQIMFEHIAGMLGDEDGGYDDLVDLIQDQPGDVVVLTADGTSKRFIRALRRSGASQQDIDGTSIITL